MKTRSILFVLVTFLSLGAAAESVSLWNPKACLQGKIAACSSDETFVRDQHKRCGCLKEGEYIDLRSCLETLPDCAKNELFSLLKGEKSYVGCGCFATR
jgi:hypothetical protein